MRPKRAFRPRSGQKIARLSAQYGASPSASFCLLFLAQQKKLAAGGAVAVLPQKRQSGETGKRADVGIGPYNMLCMDISWLGIPEMSRTEIDAVYRQLCVVHLSEAKAIGKIASLRPKRAFRPRGGQKSRASARNMAHLQAHLFAYFFWRNRKSRPSETQLRCYHKRGSPVKPEKGPMWASAPTNCCAESHAERRLQYCCIQRHSGETGQKRRQVAAQKVSRPNGRL